MRFLIKITGFFFFLLVLFFITQSRTVYAQSCSGTFACGDSVSQCQDGSGNSCDTCGVFGSSCSYVWTCQAPAGALDRSCSGSGGISACGAYGCGTGGSGGSCLLYDGCASGGPTCDATNCFNRSCTDGSGNTCECYGVCSGGSCVTGGVVPGTCTGGSSPTPTPVSVCTPNEWCGSACLSPCHTSDLYCNSTGTACNVQVGDYVGNWCGCGAAPTPTSPPSSGGGGEPVPTPDPGACTPCGAGVCCAGATCDVGPPASCVGGFVPPPPEIILPTPTPSDFCGNGVCGASEFCSTCAADCGVCTYTISGKVFVDTNGNGVQNCSGSCNNGVGDELNYQGAAVLVSPGGSQVTNSSGSYSRSNLTAGAYTITLTLPSGYTATSANPVNRTLGPSQTANFGIVLVPADCPSEITASTNTVDSGGTVNLSMSGCTGVEDPPDGSSPPPFDWDPPQDDNPTDEGDPQCSDVIDNDGDGLVDTNDPGCHWDGDSGNPGTYRPNDDNEGNVSGPRQCSDGIDNDGDGLVDIADPECHTDGNPDSNGDDVPDNNDGSFSPNDDNESDRLSPGKSGSTTCSDGELAVTNTTSTSSTSIWTAPRCATSQLVCTINGTVNGSGGTDFYTENITVRQTGVINVDIRDLSNGEACDASAPLYNGSATVGLTGTVTTTETINDGAYTFACLPNGNYTVSLGLPAGYQMISGGTSQATSITDGIKSRDIRFCIGNFEPWYQTTQGDVRMRGIVNPIPAGFVGSTDASNPSVFFSSQYTADVDAGGSLSAKNWLVNREYEYNSLTRNRNGIVAYSFYKSRARQEGIPITELTSGTLDNTNAEVLENGVYEWTGDMVINGYSHVAERAVILVNGNVTIDSDIDVPVGSLFIVAASGNITVASTVGHASPNFNTTASNLEGIYSAEGSIILSGGDCAGGVPDERLNVAGALVANAQKPFASTGGGAVQNQRSLCADDDLYPSLYVSSRPDFLTKLTDFYKVSYTKWREVRP